MAEIGLQYSDINEFLSNLRKSVKNAEVDKKSLDAALNKATRCYGEVSKACRNVDEAIEKLSSLLSKAEHLTNDIRSFDREFSDSIMSMDGLYKDNDPLNLYEGKAWQAPETALSGMEEIPQGKHVENDGAYSKALMDKIKKNERFGTQGQVTSDTNFSEFAYKGFRASTGNAECEFRNYVDKTKGNVKAAGTDENRSVFAKLEGKRIILDPTEEGYIYADTVVKDYTNDYVQGMLYFKGEGVKLTTCGYDFGGVEGDLTKDGFNGGLKEHAKKFFELQLFDFKAGLSEASFGNGAVIDAASIRGKAVVGTEGIDLEAKATVATLESPKVIKIPITMDDGTEKVVEVGLEANMGSIGGKAKISPTGVKLGAFFGIGAELSVDIKDNDEGPICK